MVTVPVLGGSPVAFTDGNGNQHEIPLSQLYFDSNGNINAGNWPPYSTYQAQVDPWLAYLVGQNLLRPGTAPPGKPALVITAREGGSAGNSVSVTFANPILKTPPETSTVDVTVSATQSWLRLKAEDLAGVLGMGPGTGTGTQPGLVFLKPNAPDPGTMPAVGSVSATGTPVEFQIPKDGGGVAFTLEPLFDDADASLLTVTINDVDTTNKTFPLMVSWRKSQNAVKLQDLLDSNTNPFAYLVSFAAPPGGLVGPPNPGTAMLRGGADSRTSPSVTATATALSG